MDFKRILQVGLVMFVATWLAGCATPQSGAVYSQSEARTIQTVQTGTVTAIQHVTIEGHGNALGAVAGGAVGAGVGHTLGGGTGNTLTTILGAVGGAIAGAQVQKQAGTQKGLQLTIKLDSGQTVAVVQSADQQFYVGQRVRLISGGAHTRVSPINTSANNS